MRGGFLDIGEPFQIYICLLIRVSWGLSYRLQRSASHRLNYAYEKETREDYINRKERKKGKKKEKISGLIDAKLYTQRGIYDLKLHAN